MNYQEIANEFLDQWEIAHSFDQPNYSRLAASYALYTGQGNKKMPTLSRGPARRPKARGRSGPEACADVAL